MLFCWQASPSFSSWNYLTSQDPLCQSSGFADKESKAQWEIDSWHFKVACPENRKARENGHRLKGGRKWKAKWIQSSLQCAILYTPVCSCDILLYIFLSQLTQCSYTSQQPHYVKQPPKETANQNVYHWSQIKVWHKVNVELLSLTLVITRYSEAPCI